MKKFSHARVDSLAMIAHNSSRSLISRIGSPPFWASETDDGWIHHRRKRMWRSAEVKQSVRTLAMQCVETHTKYSHHRVWTTANNWKCFSVADVQFLFGTAPTTPGRIQLMTTTRARQQRTYKIFEFQSEPNTMHICHVINEETNSSSSTSPKVTEQARRSLLWLVSWPKLRIGLSQCTDDVNCACFIRWVKRSHSLEM